MAYCLFPSTLGFAGCCDLFDHNTVVMSHVSRDAQHFYTSLSVAAVSNPGGPFISRWHQQQHHDSQQRKLLVSSGFYKACQC